MIVNFWGCWMADKSRCFWRRIGVETDVIFRREPNSWLLSAESYSTIFGVRWSEWLRHVWLYGFGSEAECEAHTSVNLQVQHLLATVELETLKVHFLWTALQTHYKRQKTSQSRRNMCIWHRIQTRIRRLEISHCRTALWFRASATNRRGHQQCANDSRHR